MAASVIGALRVNLGLDSAQFAKGAKRAESSVQRLKRQFTALAAAGAVVGGALTAIGRRAAEQIDEQTKLARSLQTTTGSVQVLARAGELAGVSMGEIEQATIQLTRRLSQAAAGTGPAVKGLEQLGLTAQELQSVSLDERIIKIQEALEATVPAAQRAAVASTLFGDRAGLTFSRIDPATLRQAADELRKFGVIVSDVDAAQIERTNDALSSLGLIGKGFANQVAVNMAPALERFAQAVGNIFAVSGPAGRALSALADNLGRIATIVGVAAAIMGGRLVIALGAAALGVKGLTVGLLALRVALIRLGFGALIVGAGELVFQFLQLAEKVGGVGKAFGLVGDVARAFLADIEEGFIGFGIRVDAVAAGIKSAFLDAFAVVAQRFAIFLSNAAKGVEAVPGGEFFAGKLKLAAGSASTAMVDFGAQADFAGQRAARLRSEAEALAEAGFDKTRAAIDALKAAMESSGPATDEQRDRLADLRAELEAVSDAAAGGGGGRGGTKPAVDALNELDETMKRLEFTGADVREGLSEVFAGAITGAKNLKEGLADLARSFADLLLQRGFNLLINSIFPGLDNLSIPGRATGGKVREGMTLVGERGPEIVSLPRGSEVFDAGRTAKMLKAAQNPAPSIVAVAPPPAPQVNVAPPEVINRVTVQLEGSDLRQRLLGGPEGEQEVMAIVARNRGSF